MITRWRANCHWQSIAFSRSWTFLRTLSCWTAVANLGFCDEGAKLKRFPFLLSPPLFSSFFLLFFLPLSINPYSLYLLIRHPFAFSPVFSRNEAVPNTAGRSGERYKLPSGVSGRAKAATPFCDILSLENVSGVIGHLQTARWRGHGPCLPLLLSAITELRPRLWCWWSSLIVQSRFLFVRLFGCCQPAGRRLIAAWTRRRYGGGLPVWTSGQCSLGRHCLHNFGPVAVSLW